MRKSILLKPALRYAGLNQKTLSMMYTTFNKSLTVILILNIALHLECQNDMPKVYKCSDEIKKEILNPEMAAWEYSYIGEYTKTLKEWDINEEIKNPLTQKEQNEFKKYMPIDAIEYITKKAKSEQIIIINEAHHQPKHRVFTSLLLRNLYHEGFRYLCIETLNQDDTFLETRKYPIINSGGYSKEPMYGNLIREALKIGFKLVAYEDTKNSGFDSKGNNLREVEQALNIKKILDKNPSAKLLIHCGFGHIKETPLKYWGKAMAGRLIEYTNINPLTIDQVELSEHSDTAKEDPYFRRMKYDNYVVLLDSTGKLFNGSEDNKKYDLRVYHPRTKFINGRPHWVFENNRIPFVVKQITLQYPLQIFAYFEAEKNSELNPFENAVPFDIIELQTKDDFKALSLTKGKFILKLKDKNNREQIIKTTIE